MASSQTLLLLPKRLRMVTLSLIGRGELFPIHGVVVMEVNLVLLAVPATAILVGFIPAPQHRLLVLTVLVSPVGSMPSRSERTFLATVTRISRSSTSNKLLPAKPNLETSCTLVRTKPIHIMWASISEMG